MAMLSHITSSHASRAQHLFRVLLHVHTRHFDDFVNFLAKSSTVSLEKPRFTFRSNFSYSDPLSLAVVGGSAAAVV